MGRKEAKSGPDLTRGAGEGGAATDPYISAAERLTPALPRFTLGSAARLMSAILGEKRAILGFWGKKGEKGVF